MNQAVIMKENKEIKVDLRNSNVFKRNSQSIKQTPIMDFKSKKASTKPKISVAKILNSKSRK